MLVQNFVFVNFRDTWYYIRINFILQITITDLLFYIIVFEWMSFFNSRQRVYQSLAELLHYNLGCNDSIHYQLFASQVIYETVES